MTETIRILLADDHTIFRAGVRMLLDLEQDIEVVGEAVDGSQVRAAGRIPATGGKVAGALGQHVDHLAFRDSLVADPGHGGDSRTPSVR